MGRLADVVVLLTEWNEYLGIALEHASKPIRCRVFVDLRNAYEPDPTSGKWFGRIGVGW